MDKSLLDYQRPVKALAKAHHSSRQKPQLAPDTRLESGEFIEGREVNVGVHSRGRRGQGWLLPAMEAGQVGQRGSLYWLGRVVP